MTRDEIDAVAERVVQKLYSHGAIERPWSTSMRCGFGPSINGGVAFRHVLPGVDSPTCCCGDWKRPTTSR
jgi:hypothetical protein